MRTVLLLSLLLLMACSSSRSTVQERRLQQRKHTTGWHIDLKARRMEPRTRVRDLEARRVDPSIRAVTVEERTPIAATAAPASAFIDARVEPHANDEGDPRAATPDGTTELRPIDQQEEDGNIMPRKKWNAMAVPAFASGLGAIALGFGTNLWLLIGAIALTLILAGWSIARIRRREQAGKGFAMAALLIGVFAALLTIMTVVRYGTEL